jgi:5'-deoxynucleotidase YfbR-like HD superfamily hydrolase
VAEHSFFVVLATAFIVNDLQKKGYEVDLGEALRKACLHDIPESLSSDVIKIFKNTTPELREEIERAEKIHMKRLEEYIGEGTDIYEHWKDCKDETLEGRIVHLADQLQLMSTVREYVLVGNTYFEPVAHRVKNAIKEAATGELEYIYEQVYPNDHWDDILRRTFDLS